MSSTAIQQYRAPDASFSIVRPAVAFLMLVIWCSATTFAQISSQPKNSSFSVRATHLLGFEGAPNNATGTLCIETDALQFQKNGKPAVQVKIASVQDVLLGEQSTQVGGVPMTLGKAAVPFGGGRAVSLFSHKKYDTVTLEYVDADGGLHGAIFQLNKGQGEALRNELMAKGAHVSGRDDESKKKPAEVANENE